MFKIENKAVESQKTVRHGIYTEIRETLPKLKLKQSFRIPAASFSEKVKLTSVRSAAYTVATRAGIKIGTAIERDGSLRIGRVE